MNPIHSITRTLVAAALAAVWSLSAAAAAPPAQGMAGQYQIYPLHVEPPAPLYSLFEPFHPPHLGLFERNSARENLFELFPQADNTYAIRSLSGECATVARGVLAGAPRIDMLPCDTPRNASSRCQIGVDDQRFVLRPVAANLFQIQTLEGQCWDVRDSSREPGANVLAHECHSGANQRFRLGPILRANYAEEVYSALYLLCEREREAARNNPPPRPQARAVAPPVAQPNNSTVYVGAAPTAAPMARAPFQFDMDRPGNDLRDGRRIGLADPAACDYECRNSSKQCLAWVFVKPGVQGPQSACYLKSAATPAVPNNCCVTGVR